MTIRADRIFLHATILTGEPGRPEAEAMAVARGRVIATGSEKDLRALAAEGTELIDLDGGFVTPGFHDAHLHLSAGSISLAGLDLRGGRSMEEICGLVGTRAGLLPEGAWIRGWGWDQNRWAVPGWPEREPLDRAAPRNPVFLMRADGHVAWVNTRALWLLEIGPETPDPDGGSFLRDPGTGGCTGILMERAAEMASDRLPRADDSEREVAVDEALGMLRRHGITSAEDVAEPWALEVYDALRKRGRLSARISAWLPLELDQERAEELRREFPPGDGWLSVSTLKAFLDGTLGSRSAAMKQPYDDEPSKSGMLRVDPARLVEPVRRADERGWAVALHAIGDRAVSAALDLLEGLPDRRRDRPHRIEHLQVVSGEDLPRLSKVGVVASVQPSHLAEDRPWVEKRLGRERAATAYPWRSLLRNGAVVAMGTDWPVASVDPRVGLAAAALRSDLAGDHEAIGPAEALTVREALEAYTAGSARAAGRGGELGALLPGYRADFAVLSVDPGSVAPSELVQSVQLRRTVVGGRQVHPEMEPV